MVSFMRETEGLSPEDRKARSFTLDFLAPARDSSSIPGCDRARRVLGVTRSGFGRLFFGSQHFLSKRCPCLSPVIRQPTRLRDEKAAPARSTGPRGVDEAGTARFPQPEGAGDLGRCARVSKR